MKKGNSGILILVLIGAAFFFFFPLGTETKDFLEIRMYDNNGNLIGTTENFAVVNNIPDVFFIDLVVNVENTGQFPLDLIMTSLSPAQFDDAMTRTTLNAGNGESVSWQSEMIAVSGLGLGQVTFVVEVEGTYNYFGDMRTINRLASSTISIVEDSEGDFTLGLDTGLGGEVTICGDGICESPEDVDSCQADCGMGGPTCGDGICEDPENENTCASDCLSGPTCGDGICESPEDASSCGADCLGGDVRFRTTSLTYGTDSAIAFTNICGNELIGYGFEAHVRYGTITNCEQLLSDLVMQNLPGNLASDGDGDIKLFSEINNQYWICENDADGIGLTMERYDSTDPDASSISTSSFTENSAMEVSC